MHGLIMNSYDMFYRVVAMIFFSKVADQACVFINEKFPQKFPFKFTNLSEVASDVFCKKC